VEKRRQAAAPRLPYRRYALAGGWEIWVGRSAADNDILTHELARPHDLWLHAHGASGSHVLLRRDAARGDAPPAAAVQAAAAVAAYFSAARHSRMVPVIVTEKRYVRKPRRSPPGTAVCLREKTVMAAPAAPASGEREDA
jgi:predicted ribosome quality control (RQC) complex YloA/Tae2 family protein